MKWPADTYITSIGSWLPTPTPTSAAVEAGLISADRVAELDYASVCIAEDVAPPDQAARAAQVALDRAGITGRELSMLMHCSVWFQGLDVWPVGSYVAGAVKSTAPAFDLQQRCNGSLGAIELGAAQLHGAGASGAVLITTADRFAPPAVDRWHMHDRSVYGDGGTAMVLSRQPGFARVVATATVADNTVEGITRGDAAFDLCSRALEDPIDLVERGNQFYARTDATRIQMRVMRTITRSAMSVARDSGTSIADMRRVISAASGRFGGESHFHTLIGAPEESLIWEFGRRTGHMGTGDWFAGLEYLVRSGNVEPGDHVLLLGGGAGYTCTSIVVEVLSIPDWSTTQDPTEPELVGAR